MQKTNFTRLRLNIQDMFQTTIFARSWKIRSISILSLLIGFFVVNQMASLLITININKILIALFLILILEIPVRFIKYNVDIPLTLLSISMDNFRIGATYALVLEAFKLGS